MNADDEELSKTVLELITKYDTISDDDMRRELARTHLLSEERRVDILSGLNSKGFIQVKKNQKGEIVYSYQNPEDARKLERLDENDRILFQLIKDAKTRGLSKIELKNRSGMNQKVLNGSLKALDKQGLLVMVKAKEKNRWMFFAHDQEPDVDIVGGNFYNNGEIDEDRIENLHKYILAVVRAKTKVSFSEVLKYLVDNCEEAKDLREEDIQAAVNTLLLDGIIEDASHIGRPEYVLARGTQDTEYGFESSPCFVCPVFSQCRPGGTISPQNCLYFEEW